VEEPKDMKIRVIIVKRGGKKLNSMILGLDAWGVNLQECARLLAKRFACGAASALIDYKEVCGKEGLSVQGDVTIGFENFISTKLAGHNIDFKMISYEDGGNKKTAKRQ